MQSLRSIAALVLLLGLVLLVPGPAALHAQDAGVAEDGGNAGEIQVPDPLQPCECLDCLKLFRLSSQNERKIYDDRAAIARKTLQEQIDRYKSDAAWRQQLKDEGRIFFCELWGTVEDELAVVRDYLIPESQRKLFAGDRRCLPLAGGSTDAVSCQVEPMQLLINEATAPCQQIHLAILAHELVHVQDCKANRFKPTWKNTLGTSCKAAFTGRKTPTPEQVMGFLESSFATELRAHQLESQVESLLINELTKQCKPDDYSSRMSATYKEAAKFLEAARKYKIIVP